MKGKNNNLLILIGSIVYILLFHKKSIGLNLLLFELTVFFLLLYTQQISLATKYAKIICLGFLTTCVFSVLTYSTFCIAVNIFTFLVFIGWLIYPKTKSMFTSFILSLNNLFLSTFHYLKSNFNTKLDDEKESLGTLVYKARVFAIPFLIALLFIFLYRKSNPYFDKLFSKIGLFFTDSFQLLFKNFDTALLFTILSAFIFNTIIFYPVKNRYLIQKDVEAPLFLKRKKRKLLFNFSILGLRTEYKSSLILFVVLNFILALMNILDIYFVWFNFEWKGQYLKQFVHEGTYLLITSILISMALVLYYFRRNLNFYKNNKLLKILCYIWIIQNVILCCSVAIRNLWYIKYFSMAYKGFWLYR